MIISPKTMVYFKKFNFEEKIHCEEIEIIISNEQQKLNEIFTEAIEKLATCQVSGFEPINIIRKKKFKENIQLMKKI